MVTHTIYRDVQYEHFFFRTFLFWCLGALEISRASRLSEGEKNEFDDFKISIIELTRPIKQGGN